MSQELFYNSNLVSTTNVQLQSDIGYLQWSAETLHEPTGLTIGISKLAHAWDRMTWTFRVSLLSWFLCFVVDVVTVVVAFVICLLDFLSISVYLVIIITIVIIIIISIILIIISIITLLVPSEKKLCKSLGQEDRHQYIVFSRF